METSIRQAEFPSRVRPGWADDDHALKTVRLLAFDLSAYTTTG